MGTWNVFSYPFELGTDTRDAITPGLDGNVSRLGI